MLIFVKCTISDFTCILLFQFWKLLNAFCKVFVYLFLSDFFFFQFYFILGNILACSGNPRGIRHCATSVQQHIHWNVRFPLTDLSVLGAVTLMLVPIFAKGLKSAHVYLYFFNWKALHTYSCWTSSISVDAMKHIPHEKFTSVNKVRLKPPCTLLKLSHCVLIDDQK